MAQKFELMINGDGSYYQINIDGQMMEYRRIDADIANDLARKLDKILINLIGTSHPSLGDDLYIPF